MIGGHGMNTKRKRKKNKFLPMACALGIFIGSICHSYMDAYAEALPNFPDGVDLVSAADCIMSYMTSAGMFVSNREWIDELYTSFGGGAGFYINDLYQNGLLTLDEAGHYVSTGLESALESQSAWSHLHLDELFRVTAEEAAVGGGVAATGAGTIAGAIGGVATTGVLPLALGVTGAYWGGIGLGTLIAHACGLYGKNIANGVSIKVAQDLLDDIGVGGSMATLVWSSGNTIGQPTGEYLVCPTQGWFVYQKNNNGLYQIYRVNPNSSSINFKYVNSRGNISTQSVSPRDVSAYGISATANSLVITNSAEYLQQVRAGTAQKPPVYSPDIITPDGNAVGTWNPDGSVSVPSMVPEVDPTGQSIVPGGASRDDWLRWANGVKGNNENNDPDANADILQQILEAIRNNNPTPGGNPNPNPDPSPDPSPTPVPKPDYDPENPDQPEYDPKETEGPQDVTNGDPWTTPDLLDRFPFCLPRDVYRCFQKLNVNERMAPSISWHFVTPLGIHFDFDLDLEDYEGVASILRALELIAFVIGLAIATRNLIGR